MASQNRVIEHQEKNLKLSNELAFKVSAALDELKADNDVLVESGVKYKKEIFELQDRIGKMTDVIAELRKRNQKLSTQMDQRNRVLREDLDGSVEYQERAIYNPSKVPVTPLDRIDHLADFPEPEEAYQTQTGVSQPAETD